jgi:thioesterase domain-containing protein
MAEDYLSFIRRIQPHGPYNLLGWSFGGLVAHVIATQLQSLGEEVALLALLDSYPVPQDGAQAAFDDDSENLSRQVAINPIMNLLDVLRREGLSTLKEHHYEAIMDTFKNNTRLMRTFDRSVSVARCRCSWQWLATSNRRSRSGDPMWLRRSGYTRSTAPTTI